MVILKFLKWMALEIHNMGLDRLPAFLRLANILYRYFIPKYVIRRPIEVKNRNLRMYIDQGGLGCGALLLMRGIHEEFQTKIFERVVSSGDVVVDIGAGIGYYTLIGAKLVGTQGRIYAFEPEPTNYALLIKNIELNGFRNVVPIQKGVANKTGKCHLFICETNKSGHSIVSCGSDKIRGYKYIVIEVTTIDEFFNQVNKVNVIKMDIEGAEGLAILGAKNLIASNESLTILTEFIPKALEKTGVSPAKFLGELFQAGFQVYNINEASKKLEPVTSPSVKDIHLCHGVTNLLCLKNQRLRFNG